ncbi:MAG: PDZ domain-containing protein [Candidatus Brocadiaceae bacterium]|nr:PDZ domain-containing protein [Candidatus Brocadiaceae bacterium]
MIFSSLPGSFQKNFYYSLPPILIFACLFLALKVNARGYEDKGAGLEQLRNKESEQLSEERKQSERTARGWMKALGGEEENLEGEPPRRGAPVEKPQGDKSTGGWLGVGISDITPELARSFNLPTKDGALVLEVAPNSPAEGAGLREGDIIVELGGKEMKDVDHALDMIAQTPAGKKLKGKVLRQGKLVKFKAKHLPSELSASTKRLPSEPSASPSKPGGPAKIRALSFTPFSSPQGRFTISIPAGWKFKSGPNEEIFTFTPEGRDLPEVGIGFFYVGGIAMRMEVARRLGVPLNQVTDEVVMAYMQQYGVQEIVPLIIRRYSAEDFFREILIPFLKTSTPNFRVESVDSKRPSVVEATWSGTYKGVEAEGKYFCTMENVYDPTTGGWYSFAYLSSITTQPGKLYTVIPVATTICQTFQPNDRWLWEVKQAILQGMADRMRGSQQAAAMVSQSLSRMQQMDYQAWKSNHDSLIRSGRSWADTLGGTTQLHNPTTGQYYRTNDEYKYYGLQGNDIVGTNDYRDLKGYGIQPLERKY